MKADGRITIQEYDTNPVLFDPAEVPLESAPKPPLTDLLGHKVRKYQFLLLINKMKYLPCFSSTSGCIALPMEHLRFISMTEF